MKLKERDRETLHFLARVGEPVTAVALARNMRTSKTTAYNRLASLVNTGAALRRPDGRWRITEQGCIVIEQEASLCMKTAQMWTTVALEYEDIARRGRRSLP